MDIVDTLRGTLAYRHLHQEAALEIERLRAENEILRTATGAAEVAMAGAPIWHSQHRVLSEILAQLHATLAELDAAAADPACHDLRHAA